VTQSPKNQVKCRQVLPTKLGRIKTVNTRIKLMKSITLKVSGMTCNHCVKSIENALIEKKMSGKVDLKNKTVQIEFNEIAIKESDIKSLIEELGYQVL